MLNVVLMLCTGGLTSQLFLKSVANAASNDGYRAAIDYGAILYDLDALEKYNGCDYLFLYAPATEITKEAVENACVEIKSIIISPQVRYLGDSIKKITDDFGIRCLIIEPEIFANMAGEECFKILK